MDPEFFIFDALFETIDRLAKIFPGRTVRFEAAGRSFTVSIDDQDPDQDPGERFQGISDMARMLEAQGVEYKEARDRLLHLDGWTEKEGLLVAPDWMAKAWETPLGGSS